LLVDSESALMIERRLRRLPQNVAISHWSLVIGARNSSKRSRFSAIQLTADDEWQMANGR
jgi:hypothetical protein